MINTGSTNEIILIVNTALISQLQIKKKEHALLQEEMEKNGVHLEMSMEEKNNNELKTNLIFLLHVINEFLLLSLLLIHQFHKWHAI